MQDFRDAAMSFNRQAFELQVRAKSPLTVEQFEKLFGGITAENKALAWSFMQLQARSQFRVYEVLKTFPQARIEIIR